VRAQVASVEKMDDLTVKFTLTNANPRFIVENFGVRIFGSFLIMPQHVWDGQDPATFAFNPPIGTGPYTFTSATTNRAIWDRNDNYWGAKTGFQDLPVPQRVIFLESGGAESRAQLMATNQLDAAQNVSVGTFEAIKAQNANVIAWYDDYPYASADPCARQLEINTTVEPWTDPNLRKAVATIIDRTQIANIAAEGATVPSKTMFAQYGSMSPFIDAVVDAGYGLPARGDADAGKAMIEAAGYTLGSDGIYEKDGTDLSVKIHVNSASTEYTKTIDVIVEQLNRAGIAASSVPVENGVFWGEVLPFGAYEMSYSWLSCGSVNEPWASMGRYTVKDVVPVGERSPGFNNTARWDGDAAGAYSAVVDKMASLPLGDASM
ncbi:MAG: ABC transporter substrate-binding protein, partial [Pseudomonadota bacterium]